VADKQFSLEKRAAQRPLLLKAGSGNLGCFKKLSTNSKAFGAKRLRTY
jgi:hypothetical protein